MPALQLNMVREGEVFFQFIGTRAEPRREYRADALRRIAALPTRAGDVRVTTGVTSSPLREHGGRR